MLTWCRFLPVKVQKLTFGQNPQPMSVYGLLLVCKNFVR